VENEKAVKPVIDYLMERNIPFRIKHHSKPVFTSEEAAQERGVRLSQIIKTMLLENKEGEIIVALLPGHKRLDRRKLKRVSGNKDLQFLDKESIERKMGFTVGAISPIGSILKGLPMFVDPSVFDEEVVDISSSDPKAGLELCGDDLRGLLKHATVADIAESG